MVPYKVYDFYMDRKSKNVFGMLNLSLYDFLRSNIENPVLPPSYDLGPCEKRNKTVFAETTKLLVHLIILSSGSFIFAIPVHNKCLIPGKDKHFSQPVVYCYSLLNDLPKLMSWVNLSVNAIRDVGLNTQIYNV
jgi:hypothetical protein